MDIKRLYTERLFEEVKKPYVSILIGPRQVGKSYIMEKLRKKCTRKGRTTVFYDLEQPDDLLKFSGDDSEILKMLINGPEVIFIDEFHYLKNATKILKAIHDTKRKKKIYASGSSSIEIHRHLKESLAGRFRVTEIYPLSLKELSTLKQYKKESYPVMGGLPGLVHEKSFDDKISLLKNIVQTYLMKDIKAIIREENIRAFNQLLYSIAQNQGSVATVAGFARDVQLSEPAINNHLEIMEQTRVCLQLASYSGNLANELKKSKKYYLYDPGIRNSLLNDFSEIKTRPDRGILLETCVYLAIKRMLKPNMELRFWRTRQGDEVDFIFLKNRVPYPIEVKYHLDQLKIPHGIKKFLKTYKKAPSGIVVSNNAEGIVEHESRKIVFIKWHNLEKQSFFINK